MLGGADMNIKNKLADDALPGDAMTNHASKKSMEKSDKARTIFFAYFCSYIVLFSIAVSWIGYGMDKTVWFYFAMGIGSIYVLIAFYFFYDNYLQPYITDLQKLEDEEYENDVNRTPRIALSYRSVYFWTLEWVMPAILVQFVVVVFFWMTASNMPYQQSLYTHPFMYGQIYQRMNNYMSPEIASAGFSKKLEDMKYKEEKEAIMRSAQFLEAAFSGYLKKPNIPKPADETYDKEYVDAIRGMVAKIYKIPFSIALTFAFLGTLMYTLNDILYRFFISDLYPKTFVSYIVRFLFAPALCMVIAYFFMNQWLINGAPIVFFLVGFFPQMALRYIEEKARDRLKLRREEKEEIPLGFIQGMTDYNIYRLKELGIGDSQNLAYADINYLRKNWYNDRQLGDFISQAMLLIHLKKDFSKFQSSGIRNIIAFKHVVKDKECNPEECNLFSQTVGIDKEKLLNLYKLINMSPMKERIDALEIMISKFDENERQKLKSGR